MGQASKENKISVNEIFLVSTLTDRSNKPVPNSARFIKNELIGITDSKLVLGSYELQDANQVDTSKNTAPPKLQLYLTDKWGRIKSYQAAPNSKQGKTGASLASVGPESRLYFPPPRMLLYGLASKSPDTWLNDFRADLESSLISGSNKGSIAIGGQAEASQRKEGKIQTVKIRDAFAEPDENDNSEQAKWIREAINSDLEINAIVIPRVRAIVVVFSDEKYRGSKVSITDRNGQACFSNEAGEVDFGPAEVAEKEGLNAAVLFDANGNYDEHARAYDQIYNIKIDLIGDSEGTVETNTYHFSERLRFNYKNIAGDYEIINGDPISLEETMLKQFPGLYAHQIKALKESSRQSPGDPKAKSFVPKNKGADFKAVHHSLSMSHKAISSSLGMLGSRSGAAFDQAIGRAIFDSLGGDKQIGIGQATLGDVVNTGFKLVETQSKILDQIDNYKISPAAKALADALNDAVDKEKSLSVLGKLANTENIALPGDLAKIKIPEKFRSILEKTEEFRERSKRTLIDNKKYLDAFGKAGDALSILGASGSAMFAWEEADAVLDVYNKVTEDYADKVYMRSVDVKDINNPVFKSLEKWLLSVDKRNRQVTKNGNVVYLNVTFQFDKAKFQADESFADLVEALNQTPQKLDLRLDGYTCSIGSDEYNFGLSLRRAESVKAALEKAGLDGDKVNVRTRAYGERRPVANNETEEGRHKNRRVVACIAIRSSNAYHPSREGMDALEKYRALSSAKHADFEEEVWKACKAAIVTGCDLVFSRPSANPYHLAGYVIWHVGNLLVDIYDLIDKLIDDDDKLLTFKKLLNRQHELSESNQELLSDGHETRANGQGYIDAQVRLRAEALTGLVRLLTHCAKESDGNGPGYKEAIAKYRIMEYVELFILGDGWMLPSVPVFNISLDEYWLQLVDAGVTDVASMKEVSPNTEQLKRNGFDLSAGVNSIILKATDLMQDRDNRDFITADFKNVLPIHYMAAKSIGEFAGELKVPVYPKFDEEAYLYTEISVRKPGFYSDALAGWIPMAKWIESHGSVGPYDHIRICLILNPKDPKVDECIKNDSILQIPIEVYPERRDGKNVTGVTTTKLTRKLTEKNFTVAERKGLNIQDDKQPYYGVIINPFYQYGAKQIFGIKPLANTASRWSSIMLSGDKFWQESVWDMEFAFEAKIAGRADSKRAIEYDGGKEEFDYSIDPTKVHKISGGIGQYAELKESDFFDNHYMKMGKVRTLPDDVFSDSELFCFMRNEETEEFVFPNKGWVNAHKGKVKAEDLVIDSRFDNPIIDYQAFEWDKPAQLMIINICDEVDASKYDPKKIKWKKVGGTVKLKGLYNFHTPNMKTLNMGFGKILEEYVGEMVEDWMDDSGPSYPMTFNYIGNIESSGLFAWDQSASKSLGDKYKKIKSYFDNPNIASMFYQPDTWDKMLGTKKSVFISFVNLSYQTPVGYMRMGLKPFKVDPMDQKDRRMILGFDISSEGDTGLNNERAAGKYLLSYTQGLNRTDSFWYKYTAQGMDRAKSVLEFNKRVNKRNEQELSIRDHAPLHTQYAGVRWLKEMNPNSKELSEAQVDIVNKWLDEEAENIRLADESYYVMESAKEAEENYK